MGVTFHAPGSVGECEGWTLTLPNELPFWELESWWTPQFSKNNYRGQNPLDWIVSYIIGKLLELKHLKWACMTHLDTSNTSYGQKKGRESNWEFDSRPLKVKNCPNFFASRWHATYRWKALNENYHFALDLILVGDLHTKLWAPQNRGSPNFGNFETLTWESQNKIWALVLWPSTKYTIRGKVVASPKSKSW